MKITTAQRKRAKIRLSIQGPSGSGKTFSSLLIAKGLVGDWSKICVIDTENHSADLYSHLGAYNVLSLGKPFTPEAYAQAIELCETSGMKAVIIDSLSHEWEGEGGILDIHSSMVGNSFTNWSKVTPRHNSLVQRMLQSDCHIIATLRTKQDYVLSEKNGKTVPEKVGLKSVTKDGMDYEFTTVFDLDINHNATCTKDRTTMFGQSPMKLTEATGNAILNWCESATESMVEHNSQVKSIDEAFEPSLEEMVNACKTVDELIALWKKVERNAENIALFNLRKSEIDKEGRVSNGLR
jgi:hypothetical protein